MNKGISEWAQAAARITANAAQVKDWRLSRKSDKAFKALAIRLSAGKGYVIATEADLAERHPELFRDAVRSGRKFSTRKFIWAVSYMDFGHGDKMSFLPVFAV